MEQPRGNPCPECGTPRNSGNTPSCACTDRAAEALRDARTAEAAAAEDFDPLRIRPYVELDGRPAADTPDEEAGASGTPADATMPLRAVPPETTALPTPLAPAAGRPSPDDLDLFETTPPPGEPAPVSPDDAAPPRRRRGATLLAAAGTVVAVVGAAGWASGLFSYEPPSRDESLPDETRASVPDVTPSEVSPAPGSGAPSASPSSSPSGSPSASASTSGSPSPSASSATPSPSRTSQSARPSTSAAEPAETAQEDDGARREAPPPVLRRGDRGEEVAELQSRLAQLHLYNDEIHGNFNRRTEEALRTYQWSRGLRDELGVYSPETRKLLESETREP
ncbi:peptidoglycan-binding domain-containing protein [Streptomyces thermocarboxydovorans]|uniref:Peptidoglycan-binding domain-containing protein n=1 Tax=Streptomyces thermocarboxydovorans TaxID=59298 RepID=A0ABP3SWA5_9ACTN